MTEMGRMRWAAAMLGMTSLGMAQAPCDLTAASPDRARASCQRAWMDANLKLNDLLMVGTHNSYKEAMPASLMALLRQADPGRADGLDYSHQPLSRQLDDGARQLEIDVYYDPEGGRFLNPAGLAVAGLTLDPVRRAALAEPGFKVMHVQDVDVFSVCVLLADCLGVIRRWSLAHPDHAPLLLMFNAKTDASPLPRGTSALPFDAAAWDALDREVQNVFPADALITPDDVQGDHPTLREAVLAGAWPTLGQARGKVLFALDEGEEKAAAYRGARRSLEGRIFFINTDEASPAAAYLTLNDPVSDGSRIRAAVQAGFIVRTRADADTAEARANDVRRRDAALASGAQYVSTDYMRPDARFAGGYQARLPGHAAALCNPVRAAGRCGEAEIERIASARPVN
ncbi:phosphatidylinositol-specific phospholipase C1-like protein [uncultured Brevundimonas sp.]|uniref:phosphatidylinositol-specific phospholipase C1-like protein n=1 Tax=uncultured Brevundimonas sp. TaxID=213418 RepID=UPI002617C71D|nr:phosphatidylinositol-specific phospholipase C1-like protein [uncultured Brevundimonas sp.]